MKERNLTDKQLQICRIMFDKIAWIVGDSPLPLNMNYADPDWLLPGTRFTLKARKTHGCGLGDVKLSRGCVVSLHRKGVIRVSRGIIPQNDETGGATLSHIHKVRYTLSDAGRRIIFEERNPGSETVRLARRMETHRLRRDKVNEAIV